nr:hypothetical protein [Tanacetum cinerariifolium]
MATKGNDDLPVPDHGGIMPAIFEWSGWTNFPDCYSSNEFRLKNDRFNKSRILANFMKAFYNGLTLRHRDTINAATGGTFMKRRPEECYDLIENMTTHHNDWDTSAQQNEQLSRTTRFQPKSKPKQSKSKHLESKQESRKLSSSGDEPREKPFLPGNCLSLEQLKNMFGQFMKMNTISSSGLGTLLVERKTEATKDTVHPTNNSSTKDVQPLVVLTESPIINSEPVVAPIIEPVVAPVNALIMMAKFGPSIKTLLTNKDKLSELARTTLNDHCSTVLLKKVPEEVGDLGKFLIPCDFSRMAECLALADRGASINLMPLLVWNKLSLPNLSPTYMTLELADRSISRPVGVAEDVFVKVGTFHFPADFVVIASDAGELTLRVCKEAITFNIDQTSRYSAIYNDMTVKRTNVIDIAYEEYSQEVLGFSDMIASGNPTPYYDPIVSTTSSTLTPFGESDFVLEEVDAFLALEDDPTSPEVDQSYFNTERDILLIDAFLNDHPSLPPPNQGNYLPQVRTKLKICEAKTDKSSIDEPSAV